MKRSRTPRADGSEPGVEEVGRLSLEEEGLRVHLVRGIRVSHHGGDLKDKGTVHIFAGFYR